MPHNIAGPSALIGASNFCQLAVAAAMALFGFPSGAVLAPLWAPAVGVLVEVPVMLWSGASRGAVAAGTRAAADGGS